MKRCHQISTAPSLLLSILFTVIQVMQVQAYSTDQPPSPKFKYNSLANLDIYCKPKSRQSIYKRRTFLMTKPPKQQQQHKTMSLSTSSTNRSSNGTNSDSSDDNNGDEICNDKDTTAENVNSSDHDSYIESTSITMNDSTDDVLPNDNQFYDGYEEFIRNLQQDLENDSFDIYDNDDVIIQESIDDDDSTSTRSSSSNKKKSRAFINTNPSSRTYNNNNNQNNHNKRRIPKYKRDINDDTSIPINEETIQKLIIERSKAQREKNYKKADSILHTLNNVHGVYVWDRDRLWSVSSIAPSRRYNANANSNHNYNGNGNSNNNQFGRNGHDYTQIGNEINTDICTLPIHEIHSLLSKRLEYKLVRQFNKADEIQTLLYNHGIRVHDKLKQWRGDGGIFADIEGMLSNKDYTMNEYSNVIEDESKIQSIVKLVQQWDEMKKQCVYNEADRIRSLLWDEYKVAVDDKSRTWSYGGDFGPNGTFRWTDNGPINPRKKQERNQKDWRKIGMYTQSKLSEPLPNRKENEEEVWNLIHDRLEARRVKDYDVADLIKDHLYTEYRISVDDQLRQWSVGGEFDYDETDTLRKESPTTADGKVQSSFVRVYNLRGGKGHLSEKEVSLVKAMIQRRSEEMARYNQQAAESIRNGLKKKFFVMIDDVNGEWHVRGNDFCMSPTLTSVPDSVQDSMKEIEALIRERSQAKGEGDFARADEIRSDLFDTFGIKLDDRLKEWNIVQTSSPNDSIVENDDCVDYGEDSQLLQDEESLSSMTVPMLKERLKAAGLPVSGRKAQLIDRLISNSW